MDQSDSACLTKPASRKAVRRRQRRARKPNRQRRCNVVLWNDDDHTYDYVIRMLRELFGHPAEQGLQMADEAHFCGRVIVITTAREHAELKRDQIHAYGKDPIVAQCQGSMWASIESLR